MTSIADPDHDGSGGRCPVTSTWCDAEECVADNACKEDRAAAERLAHPAAADVAAKLAVDLEANGPAPLDPEALTAVVEEWLGDEDPDRNLVAGALIFAGVQMARLAESKRSALAAIDELAGRVVALEEARHDHGLTDAVAALADDLLESGGIAELRDTVVGLVNTVDRLGRRLARLDERNLERILERLTALERTAPRLIGG